MKIFNENISLKLNWDGSKKRSSIFMPNGKFQIIISQWHVNPCQLSVYSNS